MPFDRIMPKEMPETPNWPPQGMWAPGQKGAAPCKHDVPCGGRTAYGVNEACNKCGMFEDGTSD